MVSRLSSFPLSSILALALALASGLAPTPGPALAGEFRKETLFGPETPTGPYKHPACLEELANGDLYLVYYGGKGEYARDTAVFGSRLAKGGTAWTPPVPIARDPFRSVGNGLIWQSPDGLVWLFYVVRYGETWSTSRIQFKVSRDDARTWSDASVLAAGAGMMVRNRPIVLRDGSYLLPVYRETGHDPEVVGPESSSGFYRFDPRAEGQGSTWVELGWIRSPRGNIQPAVAEVGDRLVAYCRRGGGYGKDEVGHIVRSESADGGKTWSTGVDSPFPNPNAAVDFLRLRDGHHLLIYNDNMTARTPIKVALSTDGDRTYPRRRDLAAGPGDFAYPIGFQGRDGKVHVVYTSDRRTVVNHAVFDEAWVRGD